MMASRPAPGAALAGTTPLIALDVVVLDTETTGLDVREDRLVQIGAVRLSGPAMAETAQFEVLLDPGRPMPEVAARIHGLTDAMVAGQPGFAEVAPRLSKFLEGALVVGHSIHFDLALLRFEAERAGFTWREPRALDVALLATGLDRGLVDASLDALATALGIRIEGRHTAMGDARATAEVWRALLGRMRAVGVRSLAEAETLARKPTELIERQERAGWFARPGDRPDFALAMRKAGARRAIDSFLYRHRIGDVMGTPVRTIVAGAPLADAIAHMDEHGIGCLIVTAPGGADGIVTERDVLRALSQEGAEALAGPVSRWASVPVQAAPADTLLYRALGRMAGRNLRYLGVTGPAGETVGVFTLRTLLRERALVTLTVGDEIAAAEGATDLARAHAALPGLAASLLEDGLEARDIAAVIAAETRAMTARAAELAEAAMVAEGRGGAPAPFALLVLGSGGRGETMLAPDQDNALVIDDAYGGDLDAEGDWFAEFAARMNALLDEGGVPLCKGGVMARNRPWRRRLAEWRAQLDDWARAPGPETILNVDIFHDFALVHAGGGEAGAALAEELRVAAMASARVAQSLLRAMGEQAGSHRAPLGMFGRLRRDEGGRVDLKAGGLLPIVAGARVLALRYGLRDVATPARLEAAAQAAGRGETDARLLADIHGFLMRLILMQQIADIEAGLKPANRVDPARLRHLDLDHLRDALGRIDLIHDMLRDMLAGT